MSDSNQTYSSKTSNLKGNLKSELTNDVSMNTKKKSSSTSPANSSTELELPFLAKWYIVNDSVMGGVSQSRLEFDEKNQSLQFFGQLSLENNGGFVSIRRFVPKGFFTAGKFICMSYKLNVGRNLQVRFRSDSGFDGVAYVYEVVGDGALKNVRLPIEQFRPRFRGVVLSNDPRVPLTIGSENISQLSFLVADKSTKPFQLELFNIGSCK